jgi:prolipoprotein diacylglyceryltransferase
MANTALDTFVRDALSRGESRERVGAALVSAGWTRKEVEDALSGWAATDLGIAVPRPKPYVSAREAFLYLVLFLLLGVVAWNLGSLLFALIDVAVADVLDAYSRDAQIRGAISGLVVGAPLFAWLAWHVYRQRRANPAMQRSRVRKWLTYLTLVIAACVLIGDAIGVVYNFLAGELSTRLALKLLVVAAIAGGIFAFFIRDAERGEGDEA